ncbi:hypothetical protein [Methylobacterium platani]|uniref:hypothetical protein n=1 Tax=Methylobacterium platani TaxID=427683 RepID=UPI000ABB8899|nr:hypothetical protein [Methylobacterium platani]
MNGTYRATIDTAGKLVALNAIAMLAVLILVTLAAVLFCLVRVVRPHDRRDALPGLSLGPDVSKGMRCAVTGQRLTQHPQRSILWGRDFAIAEQTRRQRMCDSSATRASAGQSFRTASASLGRVAPQRQGRVGHDAARDARADATNSGVGFRCQRPRNEAQ